MSISTRIVTMAAATLPKSLRDRYREQWLADVRDAPEQGVRPAQIALGSVAFAVTVGRPFPKRAELSATGIQRRSSIALGLGLSAALLGLSQYASMVAGDYLAPGEVPEGPTIALGTTLMTCAILGAVLALVLAIATREMSSRTRWAVVLFVIASASPIVQSSINSDAAASWMPGVRAAAIPYLAAAILVVVGLVLMHASRPGAARVPRVALAAGGVVLAVAVLSLANILVLWANRQPLRFGAAAGPRTASNPIYAQWLNTKEYFESIMTWTYFWWGAGAVVLVAAFILFAMVRRLTSREILLLGVGAAGVVLIAAGSLLDFLQGTPGIVPVAEPDIVLWLGRLALVGAILVNARLAAGGATVVPPPGAFAPARAAADAPSGGKRSTG
jgi:hypothetical protein